jgi:hypothetical protein
VGTFCSNSSVIPFKSELESTGTIFVAVCVPSGAAATEVGAGVASTTGEGVGAVALPDPEKRGCTIFKMALYPPASGVRSGVQTSFLEIVRGRCDKKRLNMTKTELQLALAEATQTSKKTAGVFLDTLSALAYKERN